MTPALILAALLMVQAPPPADDQGEPLPPGAPTDSYELSAWCYGALSEYLQIYDKVKPDLRDIDRMFGSPVVEAEPYQSDMAAARVELKMIGGSVTAAEKASPRAIEPQGVAAIRQGAGIWSVVEAKTSRELARAWLSWALPDRCDSNARALTTRSIVLGKALGYNMNDRTELPAPAPPEATPEPGPSRPTAELTPQPAEPEQAAADAATPPPDQPHLVAATAGFATPAPTPATPEATGPAPDVSAEPPAPLGPDTEASAVSTSPTTPDASPSPSPPRQAAAAPGPVIQGASRDEPQEPVL